MSEYLYRVARLFLFCPLGLHYFGVNEKYAGVHVTWKWENPMRKCMCCGKRQWFEYEKGWKGKPIPITTRRNNTGACTMSDGIPEIDQEIAERMNERDCPHGHKKGKCDSCDLIDAEARIALLEKVCEAVKAVLLRYDIESDELDDALRAAGYGDGV